MIYIAILKSFFEKKIPHKFDAQPVMIKQSTGEKEGMGFGGIE